MDRVHALRHPSGTVMGPVLVLTLALAGAATAGPRICNIPDDAPLPSHVLDALAQPDRGPEPPWGYGRLLDMTLANRRALRAGQIDPAEAETRGGTLVGGSRKIPVFPVLYANTGSAPYATTELDKQLFSGPWSTGTMRDFYSEISYGNFSLGGEVYDWYTLDENDTYYEGSGQGLSTATDRTDELMIEVLDARDGAIDFGQFDNDGPDGIPNSADDDGYVDFVAFIHPERDGACSVEPNNIWAHAWFLSNWTGSYYETDDPSSVAGVSNVRIDSYFISGGLKCDGTTQAGIGTMSHEFGHALGIKDLYDTTPAGAPNSEGLGHWGLMAAGNWNDQDHPAHMCAWSKERLGWLSYFNVTQKAEELCLPPVETHPVAVRLWTHGEFGAEYFVVENRQPIGFDDQLHGQGLVIYHVDEDVYDANESLNTVQGDEAHKSIDVECADATTAAHVANADDLDTLANRGDAADVWCPDTQTDFTSSSVPDTRSYSGVDTEVAVRGIDSCDGRSGDGWICAQYEVGVPFAADLCMVDCASDGCAEISACGRWWASPDLWIDNDDDGDDDFPAEGVDNHLWFRVKNDGPDDLSGVSVSLYYADPSMGLLFPSTGALIDTKVIDAIGAGMEVEDYVVFSYPTTPEFVDHYCIGAIATHALDPQNSEYPPNDNNVAQINHQVLVERASALAGVVGAECGPFEKKSVINLLGCGRHSGVTAVVRAGSYPEYDDVVLPDGWNVFFDPGPYFLAECEPVPLLVEVNAPVTSHGDFAYLPLTLVDQQTGEPIGGVIMEYHVDCLEPSWDGGAVQCLEPRGDDLEGPTVMLEWNPVEHDVAGNPETIQYYEVWRQDNMGGSLTHLADVAVDAEPDLPRFQFYDDPLLDLGWEWTYYVRGVDWADIPGAFSSPMIADCAALAVGETPGLAVIRLDQNHPNPFNPHTTIRFSLDAAARVRIEILDLTGRLVRTIVDRAFDEGDWATDWDGTDTHGEPVPSGVYMYALRTGGDIRTRKMIVLR